MRISKKSCTFAADLNKIMKKRTYTQPKMEVAVLPQDALMDELVIPGSGQGPADPTSAPKRRWTEVF